MGRKLKGKSGGKNLKAALARQRIQERLTQQYRKKEHDKLNKKSQPSAAVKKNRELQKANSMNFIPFDQQETLLLVGEGDFSYAKSLIEEGYIRPENMIVTSFDYSAAELALKYPHSFEDNHQFLLENAVRIFYKIDATDLIKSFKLSKKTPWSKLLGPTWRFKPLMNIMFNFPHTGKGIKDQDRNIRDHQELVFQYLRSSKSLFELVNKPIIANLSNQNLGYDITQSRTHENITKEGFGKILLSVFTGEPYDSWMIKSLAKDNGLCVQRSGKFNWSLYPSYSHRRTNSEQDTTKPSKERDARIYIFEKFERSNKRIENSPTDDE